MATFKKYISEVITVFIVLGFIYSAISSDDPFDIFLFAPLFGLALFVCLYRIYQMIIGKDMSLEGILEECKRLDD